MREFPNLRDLFGCLVMWVVLMVCFVVTVRLLVMVFGG